jgi:multiple sugar transport system permease protein
MGTDTIPSTRSPARRWYETLTTPSRRRRKLIAFYGFIAPWLIGFLLLTLVPLVIGFLISLTNYDGLNLDNLKYVGTRNYERIFDDRRAVDALTQTFKWSAYNVPAWLLGSFGLALILDQAIRAKGIFRTLFYLPSMIPVVATVWTWRIFLDQRSGLLNAIISVFDPGTAPRWFGADLALYSLTAISVWMGLGAGMIIFLAGLQGIPKELKEAARIDGAGWWRVIRHVTIPLMTPVIFFQLVLAIISSIQQFIVPMIVAGGNMQDTPTKSMYLFMVHVNRQIFTFQRYGYGTALLWLLFVIIVGLTIVIFVSSRFWVFYETDMRREGGS